MKACDHRKRKIKKTTEILQTLRLISISVVIWWAIRDSNLGPTGYEPAALTN